MPKNYPDMLEKAIRLAVEAHNGQRRKADGLPYIVHPVAVALKLVKYQFPDTVIAAAFVHDVLEDARSLAGRLRSDLGDEVYAIVKAVTNDASLPWEEKKLKYIESVRAGPQGAKAVCAADKIHNIESLLAAHAVQGPAVWKKFNRSKDGKIWFENAVLAMLKETWTHPLIEEYEKLIRMEENLPE